MKKQTFILKNHDKEQRDIKIESSLEIEEKNVKLEFIIRGNLEEYIFAQSATKQRANELWKHTCFELFFGDKKRASYIEINISPSTAWNIYQFHHHRVFDKEEASLFHPLIKTLKIEDEYRLLFEHKFDKIPLDKELIFNLAVILLDKNKKRYFYTIKKKNEEVDFHDKRYWEFLEIN